MHLYLIIMSLVLSVSLEAGQPRSKSQHKPFEQTMEQNSWFDALPLEGKLGVIAPMLNDAHTINELNDELSRIARVYKGSYNALASEPGKDLIKPRREEIITQEIQGKLDKIYASTNKFYTLSYNHAALYRDLAMVSNQEILLPITLKRTKGVQFISLISNTTNIMGETPLMHAVIGKDINLIKELLSLGIDVNKTRNDGKTALNLGMALLTPSTARPNPMRAQKELEFVLYRFVNELRAKKHYASVFNLPDLNGFTPLMYATWLDRDTRIIADLILAGADPFKKNNYKLDAFDFSSYTVKGMINKMLEAKNAPQ